MVEFMDIIKEHMNCSDTETRRAMLAINESIADKNQVILSISAKLYSMISKEITNIDYGKIPDSRGDITKIPNFADLTECITTLHDLLVEYKQDTEHVDVVSEAIEHLRENRKMWEKAFTINCDLPIALYNTIALSIVSSVSFLISGSIEFIKDTGDESFTIKLDKVGYHKSKDNLLFKNLKKFNASCRSKEMQKSINSVMSAERAVAEAGVFNEEAAVIIGGIVATATLITVLSLILPILQELVAMLYCARQTVSDYFEIQSNLVRLSAENVKLDVTKTKSERDTIYKKQMKIADTFKKISNFLNIKLKSSQNDATKLINSQSSIKYNAKDIVHTLPNSASDTGTTGIF